VSVIVAQSTELGCGLQSVAYRQHQSVKNLIRKMMSLGHLPLQVVRMTFNLLYSSGTVARLMRRFPSLRDFIN